MIATTTAAMAITAQIIPVVMFSPLRPGPALAGSGALFFKTASDWCFTIGLKPCSQELRLFYKYL